MVGGLVQQQQIRVARQRASQPQPLAPTAGQDVRGLVVRKARLRQRDGGAGGALVFLSRIFGKRGKNDLSHRRVGGKYLFLGHVANARRAAQ